MGNKSFPDIAINENGDFVVTWQDDRDQNDYYEIYGRFFNASGNPLTNDRKINVISQRQQLRPSVGIDDFGNWVTVWIDDRDGNGYYEIFSRRFDRNGVAFGGEVKVNPVSDGQQKDIEVSMNGDGVAVVTWEDDRDGNGYYEIYAQRINNGVVLGGEIHINQIGDGQQLNPSVSINDLGNFVVSWQDDRDGNGYYEIYARRFSNDGSANGNEIKINEESQGQQKNSSIAINSSGRFTVAWEDDRNKNDYYQIYARTFNADGNPRTGDELINTDSRDQQLAPDNRNG